MARESRWPFYTTTMATVATGGAVAGIAVPALNRFELNNNTTSVIIYNPDAALVLYVIPYNTVTDGAGVASSGWAGWVARSR